MKKTLSISFLIILTKALLFAGSLCAEQERTVSSPKDQIPPGYSMVLRVVHNLSDKTPDYPKHGHAVAFKRLVERRTDGKIKVDIFPLGQLYNDSDGVIAVSMGSIFGAEVDVAVLGAWDRGFSIFSLPGMFMDREHLYRFIGSEQGGKELSKRVAAKGLMIAWWVSAPVVIFTRTKPITRMENLKGLKIRVPSTKLLVEAMETIGLRAVPLNAGELYTAAQTGMVDAVATLELSVALRRLDEVFYYCLSDTIYFNQGCSVCSIIQLKKMPVTVRKIVVEAWQEAARIHEGQILNKWVKKSHQELVKRGVRFTSLSREERRKLKEMWRLWGKEQGREIGMTLITEAIKTQFEK